MGNKLNVHKPLVRGDGDRRTKYPEWAASIIDQMHQADVNRLAALLIMSNVAPADDDRFDLSGWLQAQGNRVPVLDSADGVIEALIVAESGELMGQTKSEKHIQGDSVVMPSDKTDTLGLSPEAETIWNLSAAQTMLNSALQNLIDGASASQYSKVHRASELLNEAMKTM